MSKYTWTFTQYSATGDVGGGWNGSYVWCTAERTGGDYANCAVYSSSIPTLGNTHVRICAWVTWWNNSEDQNHNVSFKVNGSTIGTGGGDKYVNISGDYITVGVQVLCPHKESPIEGRITGIYFY